MNDGPWFPYDLAFDRNLGLLTDFEQLALRAKHVAIAGLGGVGGVHLLTLARFGIGGFTIADSDHFEFPNFNRQVGATVSTLGRDKTASMQEMVLSINPRARIRLFDAGVTADNIDDFLRDADLFVDGFDFFELTRRRQVFARCAELGIPAVTAAPIGMGVAFIAFQPTGMSFERYFRLDGQSEQEQHMRFLIGLSPRILAPRYLVDPTRVDLANHRTTSSIAACQLCAGVTSVAAVKLLLGRSGLKPAPWNYQFDPYVGRFHVTRLGWGNAGPLQRLKLAIVRRRYGLVAAAPSRPPASTKQRTTIEEILALSAWSPSGDNAQPWRFRIESPDTVRVTVHHEPDNVYEYRHGEPTWLTAGILLETMRVAASLWRRNMEWDAPSPDEPHTITVRFIPSDTTATDPLTSYITLRSVDRGRYRQRALTATEKASLDACIPDDLIVDWHESRAGRWRIALMAARATGIRLRCPEAFLVHRRIIDWNNMFSATGIPARTIGVSRLTLPLMRWALAGSWERARRLNWLDATLSSQVQMDLLPGLASAAYFVVRRRPEASHGPATPAELLKAGQTIQRFWLTATKLGLAVQPLLATIAFAHYGETQTRFSADASLSPGAEKLAARFRQTLGMPASEVVFIGRIGEPHVRLTTSRSVRRPLDDLLEASPPVSGQP